jgi:hypothetical protein
MFEDMRIPSSCGLRAVLFVVMWDAGCAPVTGPPQVPSAREPAAAGAQRWALGAYPYLPADLPAERTRSASPVSDSRLSRFSHR